MTAEALSANSGVYPMPMPMRVGSRVIEVLRVTATIDDRHDRALLESGVGEASSTWIVRLVLPDGGRRELARRPGYFISPRSSQTAATMDRTSLNSALAEARWYCDALDRLTVMLDRLIEGTSPKASKKVLAQLDVASARIRDCDLIGARDVFGVVAGDVVLVVSQVRSVSGGRDITWSVNKRVYKLGDDAVYDGFNRAYIGPIVAVSAKTIKIADVHNGRMHVLKHDQFMGWNSHPIEASYRRNAEWSD